MEEEAEEEEEALAMRVKRQVMAVEEERTVPRSPSLDSLVCSVRWQRYLKDRNSISTPGHTVTPVRVN